MRLIDSDALEKTLKRNFCEDCNSYNGVRCRSCQIGDALDALEDAQTIDAVPVVRCRDCVLNNKGVCKFWCDECEEDGFCSFGYAESKDGAE